MNLCDKHYRRLKKFGSVSGTLRPEDWGKKTNHPLSEKWHHTKRSRGGRHRDWDDFWRFVSDVGEPPHPKSSLRRRNAKEPFGPGNFYWTDPIECDGTKAAKAARMREWRRRNLLHAKNTEMKRRYGITLAQYSDMLSQQGGGCAICGATSDYYALAVDHCHSTGVVRGVLCSKCNRGLGAFADDPKRLENAVSYLRRQGEK